MANTSTPNIVGIVDVSGNSITTTANALDINLKTIAASLTLATVTTVGAVTTITNAVKITGNAGGVFDAVVAATYPANVLGIGIKDNSGNIQPIADAALALDGGTGATIPVTQPMLFNNSTYDRIREIANGANTVGTGVQAVGLLAQFDDSSPTSITENQFGNLRMSANRNTYTTIRDAAGNERGVNVTANNELQILPTKKDTFAAATTFTITLASLANSTAGVGRQSNIITGNTAQSALIGVKFTAGTSPTANSLIYVYLLRGDGTLTDDNAGSSDAGITIINAPLLGTILCSAATSNATYYGMFDTKFLGSLGPSFGIAIVNSTGATANATGGNFAVEYSLIT